MAKAMQEFYFNMAVQYPEPDYPQDLVDSIVMPALRRSYDKARRDNWKLAKETTAEFALKRGPVSPHLDTGQYIHYFGWYVTVEIDDTEEEEVSENALPERPVTPKAPSRVTRFGRP